jgi:hypothetical protein
MGITRIEIFLSSEEINLLFSFRPTCTHSQGYQKYWSIVGEDVCAAVLDCLHSGCMLKAINFTHIALIPKVKNLNNLSQYRPISLCNVLYRIVAKVISNRLKKVMPFIILDSQSAFVPGRLIIDNILVA